MGASGWTYKPPYHPDIEAALRRLQREVFERGEYFKPWKVTWRYFDSLLAKPLDQLDDHERQIRRYHEALLGKPPDRLEDHERQYIEGLRSFLPDRDFVPASIEELLRTNAESGTHSILDIDGIADNPTFGVATPVPDEELVRALGTTQPTAEDVESVVSDFCENLERWQAVYFIVYKDGQPHEVRFVGRSGD